MQAISERSFLSGAVAAPRVLGGSGRRVGLPARGVQVVNKAAGRAGTQKTNKVGTQKAKVGTQKTKTAAAPKKAAGTKPLKELAQNEGVTSTLSLGALFGATFAVCGYLVTSAVGDVAVVQPPAAPANVGISPVVQRKVAVPEPDDRKVITSKGEAKVVEQKIEIPAPAPAPAVKAEAVKAEAPKPAPAAKPVLKPSQADSRPTIASSSSSSSSSSGSGSDGAISPAVLGGGALLLALIGGAAAMGGGNAEGGMGGMGGGMATTAAPASGAAAAGSQPSAKEWIENWRSKAAAGGGGAEMALPDRKRQVQAWIAAYRARS